MTSYIETAFKALALFRKGNDVRAIKVMIGKHYSIDVRRMLISAEDDERARGYALTAEERTLISNIGHAELAGFARGDSCAPKLKYCGGFLWPRSKAQRLARGRMSQKLGLLNEWHGGYTRLTPAGWALYHLIEDREG